MKFYEKLTILVVLFLIVTISTGSIIGVYVNTINKNEQKTNAPQNSITFGNISL